VTTDGSIASARIVESDKRIREGWLYEHHAKDYVNVWRPLNVEGVTLNAICRIVERRVGERYGIGEFFTQAPDAILGTVLGRNVLLARRLNPLLPGTQCSGLIAGAFAYMGLSFGVEPYAATPQDIDRFCASNPDKYVKVFGERPAEYVRDVLRQQGVTG
jgi:hypothetical protein